MIRIQISLSDSGARGGVRLSRYHDLADGYDSETNEDFIHRKKKEKHIDNPEPAVEYRYHTYDESGPVRTSKTNWLGRLDRERPKKSRIKGVLS